MRTLQEEGIQSLLTPVLILKICCMPLQNSQHICLLSQLAALIHKLFGLRIRENMEVVTGRIPLDHEPPQ